jgi:hypothetical protein
MLKLASRTVGTVEVFMESFAKLRLIVLGNIRLRVKFLNTMCKGAALLESALTRELPILAQLSLILGSEALRINGGRGTCATIFILLVVYLRSFIDKTLVSRVVRKETIWHTW